MVSGLVVCFHYPAQDSFYQAVAEWAILPLRPQESPRVLDLLQLTLKDARTADGPASRMVRAPVVPLTGPSRLAAPHLNVALDDDVWCGERQ